MVFLLSQCAEPEVGTGQCLKSVRQYSKPTIIESETDPISNTGNRNDVVRRSERGEKITKLIGAGSNARAFKKHTIQAQGALGAQ